MKLVTELPASQYPWALTRFQDLVILTNREHPIHVLNPATNSLFITTWFPTPWVEVPFNAKPE